MRKEVEGRKIEEKARRARSDEEGQTPSHPHHGEFRLHLFLFRGESRLCLRLSLFQGEFWLRIPCSKGSSCSACSCSKGRDDSACPCSEGSPFSTCSCSEGSPSSAYTCSKGGSVTTSTSSRRGWRGTAQVGLVATATSPSRGLLPVPGRMDTALSPSASSRGELIHHPF